MVGGRSADEDRSLPALRDDQGYVRTRARELVGYRGKLNIRVKSGHKPNRRRDRLTSLHGLQALCSRGRPIGRHSVGPTAERHRGSLRPSRVVRSHLKSQRRHPGARIYVTPPHRRWWHHRWRARQDALTRWVCPDCGICLCGGVKIGTEPPGFKPRRGLRRSEGPEGRAGGIAFGRSCCVH
jgi:hypothetical protein